MCALNAQIAAARSARSKKHGPLNDSVPLEESGTAQSPEELAIAAERYQQIVREMEVRLSELERQVLALYLAGCSARQIGQRLGRDEKTAENAMGRVRRKLRRYLPKDLV